MADYKGRWALVTGASAGIGATFARELAARGANVILTARREDRLLALADELTSSRGVKAVTIAADLADPAAPEKILAEAAAKAGPIDILVNNAGYGLPGFFAESDWPDHRAFLEVMVTSCVRLTHAVLPGMTSRGFGRIIQVSSVAGLVPGSAGHTLYGPAKAFLVSFAQSIAAETDGAGVTSTALCPGFTYSEFHDANGTRKLVSLLPNYMFMRAEPVVQGTLDAVDEGHVVYVPGAWNKFLVGLVKLLPRPMAARMMKKQSAKFRRRKAEV
ncbi:MAG: SDR family NAD(P)-dependent oxidoreductase [Alphaproteobacteria bacterium]|nr:SDR family NAD(P)-dependent oxidoreductase [Alphaproteobacteria bacterium]